MRNLTTSVHSKVSADADKGLKRLAKKRGDSVSYLIRMGIDIVLRSPELIDLYKLNIKIK